MIKIFYGIILGFYLMLFASCEKDNKKDQSEDNNNNFSIGSPSDFIHNIPISGDTILIDSKFDSRYSSDLSIEVEGYSTNVVQMVIDNIDTCTYTKPIINTSTISRSIGIHSIKFIIQVTKKTTGENVILKSKNLFLKIVENLNIRYMKVFPSNGRLVISWISLDKKNTKKFLIERLVGEHQELIHQFEQTDTILTDPFYVGEDVIYKIYSINNQDIKLSTWYYHKAGEEVDYSIVQSSGGGYDLYFSKCKYYNNFGQNYLTTGNNFNSTLLFNSSNINDTVFHFTVANFGDDARFWLQYLPSHFPDGITQNNYVIYGKFLASVYGDKSFQFENIAKSENNKVVYTYNGHIYMRQCETDLLVDSIKNSSHYGFLRSTPGGKYVYAINESVANSPVYIWSSSDLSSSAKVLKIGSTVPPISDNMLTIMLVADKWSICAVPEGNVLYQTNYSTDEKSVISSDGEYFFLDTRYLKLCKFDNNVQTIIWENTNGMKYYSFFDFDPRQPVCYIWDETKKFSIKNNSDFSEIKSYTLNVERIINIDYDSGKLLAISDKILIYNLSDGKLIKEIPANLSKLFFYGNQTILLGNYIYANNGSRYDLRK